jgi:hypothetical protein
MTSPKPIVAARMRYKRCLDIAIMARAIGIDATPERVNRKYDTWERWAQKRLATGYLMRITGVKRIAGWQPPQQTVRSQQHG